MARIERITELARTPGGPEGIVGPGIVAGLTGAIVMGLVECFVAAFHGPGFWTPMMQIGATYLGVDWVRSLAWAAVLGVATHLFIGAVFGVLFTALTRNVQTTGSLIAAGLALGAAVYLFMTYLVMPWADPVMYVSIDRGLFFLYHLAYGVTLPMALPLRERSRLVARRREAV
jgi:hypothetical protein